MLRASCTQTFHGAGDSPKIKKFKRLTQRYWKYVKKTPRHCGSVETGDVPRRHEQLKRRPPVIYRTSFTPKRRFNRFTLRRGVRSVTCWLSCWWSGTADRRDNGYARTRLNDAGFVYTKSYDTREQRQSGGRPLPPFSAVRFSPSDHLTPDPSVLTPTRRDRQLTFAAVQMIWKNNFWGPEHFK